MSEAEDSIQNVEAKETFRLWRTGVGAEPIRLSDAARTELAVAYVDGGLSPSARRFVAVRLETDEELHALVDDLARMRDVPIESISSESVEGIVSGLVPGRLDEGLETRSLRTGYWTVAASVVVVGAILGFYGGHSLERDRELLDRAVMEAIWKQEQPTSPWYGKARGPV